MASMIDNLLGRVRDPSVSQGLLALGGSMMQAGAQGQPTGAALGQGLQAFTQAQAAAQDRQREQQLRALVDAAIANPTEENLMRVAAAGGPQVAASVVAQLIRPATARTASVVAPGGALVGPSGEVLFQNPARPPSETPYYTPVPTAQGVYTFNNRTGRLELAPGVGGAPVLTPTTDPTLKRTMAEQDAAGGVVGKQRAEAQMALPQTIANAEKAVNTLNQLVRAPGFQTLYGKSGVGGVAGAMPGTAAADARALLNQVRGESFLTAYESLRGSGAITDKEGEAATLAMSRLFDTNQSDASAMKAAADLLQIVTGAVERAKAKAGGGEPSGGKAIARTGRTRDGRRVVEYTDGTREVQ